MAVARLGRSTCRARQQPLAAVKALLGAFSLLASLASVALLLTLPSGASAQSWQAETALILAGVGLVALAVVVVAVVVDAALYGWRLVRAEQRSLRGAEEVLVVHALLLAFAALPVFVFAATYRFLVGWSDAGLGDVVVRLLLGLLVSGGFLAVAALVHGAAVVCRDGVVGGTRE